MPGIEILPTPSVESPAAEPATQETTPSAQADGKPQETEPSQVEAKDDNKPQVTEPQRRRPSEYYRERERSRRLEETVAAQSKQLEEMASLLKNLQKPDGSGDGKFSWDEFVVDPDKALSARDNKFLAEIEGLKNQVNQWKNSQAQTEQAKHEREALEILFPKAGPEDGSTWEDRSLENPDRTEKVLEILKTTGLGKFSAINPGEAARLALILLEKEPKTPPTVIKKSLMGGSARGNPGMGGQRQTSLEEKRAELKKLSDEASSNPELRFDEKHKARREQLIRELERLA